MVEKIRVLVVEPEQGLCVGIRDILELEEYHVLATCDAHAARLVVDAYVPALIIVAYSIYNGPEYDVLIGHCQHLYPSLYLCYASIERLKTNPLYNHEDMYLEKPFDVEDLLNCVILLSHKASLY
jgi:DNA-binding response OmpR family regulator